MSFVLITPVGHRQQHWLQIEAFAGQHVLIATTFEGAFLEDTFVNEFAEARGEDIAGNTQAVLKLIEPPGAEERVPEDQQRPAITDDFEGLGEGAVHVFE